MKRNGKKLLTASMGLFLLASAAILPMAIAAEQMNQGKNTFAYLLAAVFWLATAAGYLCFLCAWNAVRKSRGSSRHVRVKARRYPVANTREGAVCNVVFLISAAGYAVTQILLDGPEFAGYLSIFLLIASFHMQIVCNSETFMIYRNKLRRGEKHEDGYMSRS